MTVRVIQRANVASGGPRSRGPWRIPSSGWWAPGRTAPTGPVGTSASWAGIGPIRVAGDPAR